jgi:hypothetical protein
MALLSQIPHIYGDFIAISLQISRYISKKGRTIAGARGTVQWREPWRMAEIRSDADKAAKR